MTANGDSSSAKNNNQQMPLAGRVSGVSILGTGWLGLPLALHFKERDWIVRASTRTEDRLPELSEHGLEPIIIDLDREEVIPNEFLQSEYLIVNIPSKNVEAFKGFERALGQSAVKHVLFISSTSVYKAENRPVSEDKADELDEHPLLTIEKLFSDNDRFQTTILRFAGLIGYNRHPGRFFRDGRVVPGPDAPVNMIHRDDCIGIIDAIFAQDAWGEVFNGCADTHPVKRDFYTKARKDLGQGPPEFAEPGSASYKIVSNDKVKRVLNYDFRHPDLMNIPL